MKFIAFRGGLGNQLYQYTFLRYLKLKYPNEPIYSFFPINSLKEHNGLEIERWFDIKLPRPIFPIFLFGHLIYMLSYFFSRFTIPIRLINTDSYYNKKAYIYDGYWQDKKYLLSVGTPNYSKVLSLDTDNQDILGKIKQNNSVSIHIRRGDYIQSSINRLRYGNICTLQYYQNAILKIRQSVHNPLFFIFSDDLDYVRKHFNDNDMIIVSLNTNERSFFDLYLMSHCQHMILANSTFSFWAAYMNNNRGNIICPSKLVNNLPSPPIALADWIKIDV